MLREKFNTLVMETVTSGYQRGIDLFVEDLNTDLERDAYLSESTLDDVLDRLVLESEQSR